MKKELQTKKTTKTVNIGRTFIKVEFHEGNSEVISVIGDFEYNFDRFETWENGERIPTFSINDRLNTSAKKAELLLRRTYEQNRPDDMFRFPVPPSNIKTFYVDENKGKVISGSLKSMEIVETVEFHQEYPYEEILTDEAPDVKSGAV